MTEKFTTAPFEPKETDETVLVERTEGVRPMKIASADQRSEGNNRYAYAKDMTNDVLPEGSKGVAGYREVADTKLTQKKQDLLERQLFDDAREEFDQPLRGDIVLATLSSGEVVEGEVYGYETLSTGEYGQFIDKSGNRLRVRKETLTQAGQIELEEKKKRMEVFGKNASPLILGSLHITEPYPSNNANVSAESVGLSSELTEGLSTQDINEITSYLEADDGLSTDPDNETLNHIKMQNWRRMSAEARGRIVKLRAQ